MLLLHDCALFTPNWAVYRCCAVVASNGGVAVAVRTCRPAIVGVVDVRTHDHKQWHRASARYAPSPLVSLVAVDSTKCIVVLHKAYYHYQAAYFDDGLCRSILLEDTTTDVRAVGNGVLYLAN